MCSIYHGIRSCEYDQRGKCSKAVLVLVFLIWFVSLLLRGLPALPLCVSLALPLCVLSCAVYIDVMTAFPPLLKTDLYQYVVGLEVHPSGFLEGSLYKFSK